MPMADLDWNFYSAVDIPLFDRKTTKDEKSPAAIHFHFKKLPSKGENIIFLLIEEYSL
jgi:hypothetical protein